MHPSFESLQATFTNELNKLTPEALERHPNEDHARWNARQIVEHLILTYRLSSKTFTERLKKSRPTHSQPNFKQRIAQIALLRFGYFPNGIKAPEPVVPSSAPTEVIDGLRLAASYAQALQAMDAQLVQCEQHFGKIPFATHQVLGPITPSQWRRFHIVHGRHHLSQLQKLSPRP